MLYNFCLKHFFESIIYLARFWQKTDLGGVFYPSDILEGGHRGTSRVSSMIVKNFTPWTQSAEFGRNQLRIASASNISVLYVEKIFSILPDYKFFY